MSFGSLIEGQLSDYIVNFSHHQPKGTNRGIELLTKKGRTRSNRKAILKSSYKIIVNHRKHSSVTPCDTLLVLQFYFHFTNQKFIKIYHFYYGNKQFAIQICYFLQKNQEGDYQMYQTIQINEIEKFYKGANDKVNEAELLERVIAIAKKQLIFKPVSKFEELNFNIYKKEYLVDEQKQIVRGLLVFSEEITVVDEDTAFELDTLNAFLYKDVFLLKDGSLRIFECYSQAHWVRNDWFIDRKLWTEAKDQTLDNSTARKIAKAILQMLK